MERKYLYGSIALAMIAVLGISMVSAFGFGDGFLNSGMSDEDKQARQEQREAMRTAVQNGDFDAWKSLMEARVEEMRTAITKENFDAMVDKHAERAQFRAEMEEARESGDTAKMQELREQYGMGPGNGKGKGMGMGGGKGNGNCPMLDDAE